MPAKPSATGLQIPKAGKGAKSPKMGRKSRGASPVPSLTECTEEVVKVETTDRLAIHPLFGVLLPLRFVSPNPLSLSSSLNPLQHPSSTAK